MFNLTLAICFYNGAAYLPATLESLHRQTFPEFHLLLIDDGSTDDSLDIAKSFCMERNWADVEFLAMPKNRGTAWCRDFALRHADTPLMMFFDSDDIAKPEMVETLLHEINSDSDLIAVSCYCSYMDAKGHPLKGGLYLGPRDKMEFLDKASSGKMMFLLPPTLFKREYAVRAGGYRQEEWFPSANIRYEDLSEDVDLWGRMSDFYAEGKWMKAIPEVLFFYRKNTTSLSSGFAKSRGMGQKMLYIKANQLRRRAGLTELNFTEFWNELSLWRKFQFERQNLGSYFYREACFAWVQRNLPLCALKLGLALLASPLYPLEKYRANFRKK